MLGDTPLMDQVQKEIRMANFVDTNDSVGMKSPTARPNVYSAVGELHDNVDRLDSRLEGLHSRISPVLNNEVSENSRPGGEDSRGYSSDLAQNIGNANDRLTALIARVDWLLERIDL